jgi:cellulose synthase/poly-beta-1,6-N-acetylglucosamine synthase-like glycosyltransferase
MITALAALYALALAVLLVYGLNLLVLSLTRIASDRLRPGTPPPDPEAAPPHSDDDWPAVTVQLPLYNEAHVARRLINACARLDYPKRKLDIQVLDDSTDDTTERAARCVRHWQERGVDITLIHRDDRNGYKAGALKNGLRLARGELIAVFDADFAPQPDFLRRIVPRFDDEDIGMVQARWGHLNDDRSLLTRLQALGLDTHFAVEQHARHAVGCFINFNGTAGCWRRRCIEDAGGWHTDTLTEDLDLSYRAQLEGWRFRYVPALEVPAELPPDLNALRAQQFRWTKGGVKTARKLLGRLWSSDNPLGARLQGAMHLSAYGLYPFVLVAAALHAPLLVSHAVAGAPGLGFFTAMSAGLVGFAGFVLALVVAQRALYPDWKHRLRALPLYVAGSMGLAVSNTRAVWQALRGRRSAFSRTPKHNTHSGRAWHESRYALRCLPAVAWAELGAALYCGLGLVALVAVGAWTALPFQVLFTVGFGLAATASFRQAQS